MGCLVLVLQYGKSHGTYGWTKCGRTTMVWEISLPEVTEVRRYALNAEYEPHHTHAQLGSVLVGMLAASQTRLNAASYRLPSRLFRRPLAISIAELPVVPSPSLRPPAELFQNESIAAATDHPSTLSSD